METLEKMARAGLARSTVVLADIEYVRTLMSCDTRWNTKRRTTRIFFP